MKPQRKLPEPTLGAPEAPRLVESPPSITITPTGIVVDNPTIRLGDYAPLGPNYEQVRVLTPKRCVIVAGAIVIEEMGLIVPLAGNHVRTSK